MTFTLAPTPANWHLDGEPAKVRDGWWSASITNGDGGRREMDYSATDEAEAYVVADAWREQSNGRGKDLDLHPDALDVPMFLRRQAD